MSVVEQVPVKAHLDYLKITEDKWEGYGASYLRVITELKMFTLNSHFGYWYLGNNIN